MTAAIDSRIKFLVSLAGMVDTKGFYEREFGQEKPIRDACGKIPVVRCRKPSRRICIKSVPRVLAPSPCVCPGCWSMGRLMDVVPLEDSKMIFSLANEPKHLVEIPDADHLFPAMLWGWWWKPFLIGLVTVCRGRNLRRTLSFCLCLKPPLGWKDDKVRLTSPESEFISTSMKRHPLTNRILFVDDEESILQGSN